MPQLDPSSYPSQLFWLVLTFVPLFFILWKVALPKVAAVLAARQARIESDLDRAATLRDEAAEVLAQYEAALAGAHERARAALRKLADEMAAEAAARHAELGLRLGERVKDAEARIAGARETALANIRGIAGEAAEAATERLIGVKAAPSAVAEALAAETGERR